MRMNIRRAPKQQEQVPQELLDRCLNLGLVNWRLDLNGMPVDDPIAPSMIGLWLSSRPLRSLLTEAAMIWTSQDELESYEIHPGLWVFPFIEEHRERRTGYFVTIGFGPEILSSPLIEDGLDGNVLQVSALRHVLKDIAVYDATHAPNVRSSIEWMHNDLRKLKKNHDTIELFSEQLGDSYEVVTTLEDIGKSMGSLHDPGNIILDGITEIASTLDYNWVACVINKDHDSFHIIGQSYYQAGIHRLNDEQVKLLVDSLNTSEPIGAADSTKIFPVDSSFPELEPQLLMHPIERNGTQMGMIIAGGKNGDDPQVSSHETKLLESIAGMLGACMENAELYHRQHLTFLGTVRALSAAIDAKDQYTQGHSERVAMLSALLALKVGYSEEEVERIRISGLVHDVGKIGVSEAVLCKPGRLTEEEFDMIKTHPRVGYEIMKDIPDLQGILPGVLHHHERWDGNGYPEKLAGEHIPHMARIMALADTFDAMSSNRAYRSGMDRDKVFAEFRKCAGSQFDPELVEPFLSLDFTIYDTMVEKHKSQSPVVNNAA
jgi:HD-GYP domain-containing protein (c-di-GMP phosphodiesterase class II)